MEPPVSQSYLAIEIEHTLLEKYGPLMADETLRAALGYCSMAAFRQALSRGLVPVPVFSIPRRRGKFALVRDIAAWLAEQRERAAN